MKIDPYKNELRYRNWQATVKDGIPEISKVNSDIILQYLYDMEYGLNVSAKSVKGSRGFHRLNSLREKMIFFVKKFSETYGLDNITHISEEQIIVFFAQMRNGQILKKNGEKYKSTGTFVKVFKAFWHWWQMRNRKKGIIVSDITVDLDVSSEKPKWVYLKENDVKELYNHAKLNYRALIMFLYDTGIRSPGELSNIKVSDFYENFTKLHIRDEIIKKRSFGRKIKLMLSSETIRQYVKDNDMKKDDYLFKICPQVVNRYLQRLARRVLGDKVTLAGDSYDHLTMYDFRHCSCCYWLPRYKSESALKYRFGWRKSDKIHYYSELLGMKDTITEEDMLMDLTKTEIEKRLVKTEQENQILKEKIEGYESDIQQVKQFMTLYIKKLEELENS